MIKDFWIRRIPPDSEIFITELQIRVGEALDKGLTYEQRREFDRILCVGEDVEDFFLFDEEPDYDDDCRLIERVLYDKYPDGNWQEDAAYRNLVDNQGYARGSFELKKELASVFWLDKNCPRYKHIVAEMRAALYAEFGHGRVYFHPDLSVTFREAVNSGNAERIRSAFSSQKPCPLTNALGNRFLSRDALIRIADKIETLVPSPEGKSRREAEAVTSLLHVFDDEARLLAQRTPATEEQDGYKYQLGDKRLSEMVIELLSDEALVLFTQSLLDADAKEILFADDEDKSRLMLCLDRNKTALKRAYDSAAELGSGAYAEAITDIISDIENTISTSYSLALKSGRERR